MFNWLKNKIAKDVEDKMMYMGTCPNERDVILHIIAPKKYPQFDRLHCNLDCWHKECKNHG